jgi:hypothetical protein
VVAAARRGWSGGGGERWGFRPSGPLGFVAALFYSGSIWAHVMPLTSDLTIRHFRRVEFVYLKKKVEFKFWNQKKAGKINYALGIKT